MNLKNTLKRYTLIGAAVLSTGLLAFGQTQKNTNDKKIKQDAVVRKIFQEPTYEDLYYPNGQKRYEQKDIDSVRREYYDNGQLKVEYPACPDGIVPKNVSYDIFGKDGKVIQNRTLLRSEYFCVDASNVITVDESLIEINEILAKRKSDTPLDEKTKSRIESLLKTSKFKTTGKEKRVNIPNLWRVTLYGEDQKVAGSYVVEDADFLCRDASEGSIAWKTGYLKSYSLPDENGKMHQYNVTSGNVLKKHLSVAQLRYLDSWLKKKGKSEEIKDVPTNVLLEAASQSR